MRFTLAPKVALLFALSLFTLPLSDSGYAADAKAPTKIVLGYTPVAETVAAYAALKEGYFKANGLDVNFLLVNNSAVLANSLVAQSIDIASITPSVFLQAVDNGIDFVAICGSAVADHKRLASAVIVRDGLNLTKAKDFEGKKVAVSGLRSATQIEFINWMEMEGADPKKVQFLEAPFPALQDLLKSGSVDAALSVQPFVARAQNAHVAHIATYLTDKVPTGTSLVFFAARREWVQKHPAEVKAFRDAVAKGIDLVQSDQAKAHAYVGEMLKLPADAALQTEFGTLQAALSPTQLQWWIDVMHKQNLIRNKLDANTLVAK